MLPKRNPATGIITERKRNLRNLPKWKKKIHISYREEKAVGPVRDSSHTAASLMPFHPK